MGLAELPPSLPPTIVAAATGVVFLTHLAKATEPVDKAKEGGESGSDVDAEVVPAAVVSRLAKTSGFRRARSVGEEHYQGDHDLNKCIGQIVRAQ